MDPSLYRALTTGTDLHLLSQNKDKLLSAKTGNKNTVLHVASQYGQHEVVKIIISFVKDDLLLIPNEGGEYALHLAARGGHTSVVRALIDCAKANVGKSRSTKCQKMLRRERYIEGYTPLHDAVQNHHVAIVKMLTEEDPDYSYSNSCTDYEGTPLYMAARRGYDDLVDVIITNLHSPDFIGPLKRTALHGAVICNSKGCAGLLLKWKPTLNIMKDLWGQTPLHYVANFGFVDMVSQLQLSCDIESSAKLKDHLGNTALLMAAYQGHVSVMKEILLYCPDSWDMVGYKGRNILHMAIVHQRNDVIQYILQEGCQIIDKTHLINKKDFEGNTPLHLLALSDFFVPQLTLDPMVDKGVLNSEYMTALDLAMFSDKSTTTKDKIVEELKGAGATSVFPYLVTSKRRYYSMLEGQKKRAKTHTIVNTLVATIAFAAGFTMPGGYVQSDSEKEHNQGMSILAKSASFQAFIISDAIALLLSTTAIFLYFFSSFRFLTEIWQFTLLQYVVYLNQGILVVMMLTFITGTFAVLRNSIPLASVICVVGFCYFVVYIVIIGIYLRDFRFSYLYVRNSRFPTRPTSFDDKLPQML